MKGTQLDILLLYKYNEDVRSKKNLQAQNYLVKARTYEYYWLIYPT